jgi:hypothetical protein
MFFFNSFHLSNKKRYAISSCLWIHNIFLWLFSLSVFLIIFYKPFIYSLLHYNLYLHKLESKIFAYYILFPSFIHYFIQVFLNLIFQDSHNYPNFFNTSLFHGLPSCNGASQPNYFSSSHLLCFFLFCFFFLIY